ncbi:2-hydroxy-3-oxopropionate reductase [Brachybacterium endophyticum]|uniref:2-hydroxy-3-oxopropionate reductase n=1 Tax=Brachybacterium endophyticum TaxID=2182385 RepID=A0A2U2RNF6_9MICO|nr:2-hydroxy-3-oxopropionate reductase [Brachybacterium endophyticum]PWH07314.1 2-hydroxy-3-oxopropionate reductase [Brachybacterium endophyticum]
MRDPARETPGTDRKEGPEMTIGFIGLGIMGRPMAKNLLAAGHELVVHNRSAQAMEDLAGDGAGTAATPREVAERADIVLTMLPDGPDVEAVVLGEDGVLEGATEGTLLVDMSSIAPDVSRRLHDALSERGVAMLDAPVSGGEPGAIDGSLAFMVGGEAADLERARELLEVMGASVTHVGPIGAGNIAKLANQAIVAVNIAVLGEAAVLARAAGVEPEAVLDAIRGGLAGSKVMEQKGPKMLSGDFAPGFRIDLHIKDLENTLATGHENGAALPLTAAVREMMTAISVDGHARDDHSALATYFEKLAGRRISA